MMSVFTHRLAQGVLSSRVAAASLVLTTALLCGAPGISRADTSTQSGRSDASVDVARTHGETVEQRIASLHKALRITPGEEPDWAPVAQTMRDNAAAMQRLISDNTAIAPESMTALDQLRNYQAFAQAHVDGLKNLTAAFQTLYFAMPDDQKKLADQVFRTFGRKGHHPQG